MNQAQEKVRLDLNSARVIYQEAVDNVRQTVRLTSTRFFIKQALAARELEGVAAEFEQIRQREGLDILTITDGAGKVLLRARNPDVKGDIPAAGEMLGKVFSKRKVVASTEIIAQAELLKENGELAARAHIRFVHTPKAKPGKKNEETSGMMLMAAAPVWDESGKIFGALYGGKLLNRDYSLVDKIKDTVYRGEVYDGKDIGTATVFQGDVRI